MIPDLKIRSRAFGDSILYGYAQIFFSNRRWFGFVLLAATFFRPDCGVLGLAGIALSNLMATVLRFDEIKIQSGFYGFNGILFGAAYAYYFPLTPLLLALFPVFILITFLLSAVLENYLAVAFNLPGLSLPFLVSLYIAVVFLGNYSISLAASFPVAESVFWADFPRIWGQYFLSLSLIFFQTNPWAGVLIALGLLCFSRVLFVLSLVGYFSALLFMHLLLPLASASLLLLAGLNGALVAIALGGSLTIPSRKSLLLAVMAVLMVVVFTGFFIRVAEAVHLPVMVLPFNLVVLATLYSLKFRRSSGGLVLLYFAPGSPEENYDVHHAARARFEKFRGLMPDLPFLGEWTVSQGVRGPHTHQGEWQYAWDFVVRGEDGKTFQDHAEKPEDYHAYNLPLLAPLDGEVVRVVDHVSDNPIGEVNLDRNWGNTIVLKHADGFYSSLSHLKPNSAKVVEGAQVKRGSVLAHCGSSGRSPEPHAHFQFQSTDKVGAKTLAYPFGYYLENRSGEWRFVIAGEPVETSLVQNLLVHPALKKAFSFSPGSRLDFRSMRGEGAHLETWEVKVDIYNSLYLESSERAWANLLLTEKCFSITDFRGNKRSALYAFCLCAQEAPLGFVNGLMWQKKVPLSKIAHFPMKPLAELFLLAGNFLEAIGHFYWRESAGGKEILLESEITIGSRKNRSEKPPKFRGELKVSAEGVISGFSLTRKIRKVWSVVRVEVSENEQGEKI